MQVRPKTHWFFPSVEDHLEKRITVHSSILAWRIPGKEASGGLQFIGLYRVGHDSRNLAHVFLNDRINVIAPI